MRGRLLAGAVAVVALATSCGGGGGAPEIRDARVGRPTGPNAALYFTAVGGEEPDRLVAAHATVADAVRLHETITGGDGTMSMRAVESLELPAGETLVLEPGGYHLMLTDVEPIEVGDEIDVTLVWENGGEWVVSVEVVEPGDTMSHDG